MRIRQMPIEKLTYDYKTHEICVIFKHYQHHVHGYVCPTPDGPLKKIQVTPWAVPLASDV